MRDEFNEEFDNPMDETVLNVINDITMRAATARSAIWSISSLFIYYLQ